MYNDDFIKIMLNFIYELNKPLFIIQLKFELAELIYLKLKIFIFEVLQFFTLVILIYIYFIFDSIIQYVEDFYNNVIQQLFIIYKSILEFYEFSFNKFTFNIKYITNKFEIFFKNHINRTLTILKTY